MMLLRNRRYTEADELLCFYYITRIYCCAYDYVDEQMEGWFEQLMDDLRIVQVYMYVYILDACIRI